MVKVIKGLKAIFNGERVMDGMDVAFEDDVIVDIGYNLRGDKEIILDGKVLYPAFVDPHTHLIYLGDRLKEFEMKLKGATYMETLKSGGGIYTTVKKTVEASDNEILAQTLNRLENLKSYGVRVVEIKTGYGVEFSQEIRLLKLINLLSEKVNDMIIIPTLLFHVKPHGRKLEEYISPFFENFNTYKDLLKFVDVFADEGAFNYHETERILKFFTERGVVCRLHADEFITFGSELAAKYKCISADHLLNVSDRGLEMMSKEGVIAVLCPSTGFFLGKGFAPYKKIVSRGIEVALASDHNPGTSPFLNPFITIFLAIFGYGMQPEEAFKAHTLTAARSLGLRDVGKIEVGYKAMMFAMDFTPYEIAYWGNISPSITLL